MLTKPRSTPYRGPQLPKRLREAAAVLRSAGYEVYLVGGAVRNLVMGREPSDFDLATNAHPDQVIKLFDRVIPTGIEHGTVTVLFRGLSLEITTFRSESTYSDGRRPDSVEFGTDLVQDLSRRDFTMNAIALDLASRHIIDPFLGQSDIRQRIIRTVGDPAERLAEDALRVLRAIRFAVQIGFTLQEDTLAALPSAAPKLSNISVERVRLELEKILQAPQPSVAFRCFRDCDILRFILPEFIPCIDAVTGDDAPELPLYEHLINSMDAAPRADQVLRLAALLHDIGKPVTQTRDMDGRHRFIGHERESARVATELLKRLRFPTKTVREVEHLVRHHMFFYDGSWSDAAVRRFISRVGAEHVPQLISLRRADTAGKHNVSRPSPLLDELRQRVVAELEADSAVTVRDLAIGGNELAELGIPRGPAMGKILEELLETVLDDPDMNKPQLLATVAERMYRERFS